MRKKRIFGFLFIAVLLCCGIFGYSYFFAGYDITLETANKIEVAKSKFHEGGSWWGYNQKKLASIADVTFSFVYDNSNLDYGNSSEQNPFACHLITIKDGSTKVFASVNTNATCNVLADAARNKVYYIVNEPVGEANNGGFAWTGSGRIVVYTYDYNPTTGSTTLSDKRSLVEAEEDGRQRMGAAINDQGQIIVAYGSYDAMLHAYIYDPLTDVWTTYATLSNDSGDSLMYNYAIIKSLEEFYILAVQDTARNNTVYYQYVKFFGYKDGTWIERMVVDYRGADAAGKEAILVEHKEFTLINDQIHIITRSDFLNENKYYIWDNEELIEQDLSFIENDFRWLKILPYDDDLLFIYNCQELFWDKLEIYSFQKKTKIFCDRNFISKAYIYVNLKSDNTLQVLGICGDSKVYAKEKAYLYEIKAKD
jgi:hypothetical protein